MQHGWESQALSWAQFTRTPGHDGSHEQLNLPALLDLMPAPGSLARDSGVLPNARSRSLGGIRRYRASPGWRT
jgi:hypothetical protein